MRIDSRAFGLAAGMVSGALFTLCAVAVAIAPVWTTSVAGFLLHVDLSGVARTLTWGSFFGGLLCWSILVGLVFASLGGLYNRFLGRAVAVRRRDVATPLVA